MRVETLRRKDGGVTAGGSAAEKAAAARRVADRRQREAEKAARVAEAWEKGRDGEARLAAVLEQLATDGYRHLPDRALPGSAANIDHLLVGPAGVFVLDAKNWSGEITVTDGALRQNGHRRMHEVESARSVALTIAANLEGGSRKVDVRPALCFVGDGRIGEPVFFERVKLIDVDDVVGWIRPFPAKLTEADVAGVHQHLLSAFPTKTAEAAMAVVAEEPTELVVYLVPWKKAGKHRLYVRSNDGADVGYLDLVTGHCSSPSAEWEAILAQLLPHYLRGDTPGMKREDLSDEAQGVIRRFLDSLRGRAAVSRPPERPIIACYRWKKHGKDRLYLSRLVPGRDDKIELGSFDLDSGMLRPNGPGVAGTLGYCGQRFMQLEQQRLPLG
jgi:hypothetical protein